MDEPKIPEEFLTELNRLAEQHDVPLKLVMKFFLREINRYTSFNFVSGFFALNWIAGLLNDYDKRIKEQKANN